MSTVTPQVRDHYASLTLEEARTEAARVRADRNRATTNRHRGGYQEPVGILDADRLAVLAEIHGV